MFPNIFVPNGVMSRFENDLNGVSVAERSNLHRWSVWWFASVHICTGVMLGGSDVLSFDARMIWTRRCTNHAIWKQIGYSFGKVHLGSKVARFRSGQEGVQMKPMEANLSLS